MGPAEVITGDHHPYITSQMSTMTQTVVLWQAHPNRLKNAQDKEGTIDAQDFDRTKIRRERDFMF